MLRRGATTGPHHQSPERPVPYRLTGYGSVLARPGVNIPRCVGC